MCIFYDTLKMADKDERRKNLVNELLVHEQAHRLLAHRLLVHEQSQAVRAQTTTVSAGPAPDSSG
jgi:hypothetical protein